MYKVWINEKEKGYNLYVNKCEILKIFYLCKVSFRLNLKCNVHNLNNLNKYMYIVFLISIVHAHCNNISVNHIYRWKGLLVMQKTWWPFIKISEAGLCNFLNTVALTQDWTNLYGIEINRYREPFRIFWSLWRFWYCTYKYCINFYSALMLYVIVINLKGSGWLNELGSWIT